MITMEPTDEMLADRDVIPDRDDLIRSSEFRRVAGITERQHNYWREGGVVRVAGIDRGYGRIDRSPNPRIGSGMRCMWTVREATVARRLNDVLGVIGSNHHIDKLAMIAGRLREAVGGEIVEIANPEGTVCLLVVAP